MLYVRPFETQDLLKPSVKPAILVEKTRLLPGFTLTKGAIWSRFQACRQPRAPLTLHEGAVEASGAPAGRGGEATAEEEVHQGALGLRNQLERLSKGIET